MPQEVKELHEMEAHLEYSKDKIEKYKKVCEQVSKLP